MAGEWPTEKVASLQARGVLRVEDGNHGEYRPRRDEFVSAGTSFIRAADMADGRVLFDSAAHINDVALSRIRKGIGAGGDILLSHKGTVGKVACVPTHAPPFVCSPQTTFWRTQDENIVDRNFLYSYMRSADFRNLLQSRQNETDMAAYVSLTAQKDFDIPVPRIEVQRKIAGLLTPLDDKIELNRQMNRTLEAMARAIFKAWFVDFEPVKAKAAGATSFRGMPQAVFDQLPDRFTDTELGPVPEEWKVKPISSIASLSRDSITPADSPDEIFEHFSIPAFDAGKEPARDLGDSIKSNKYSVSRSCVLVSKLNPRFARVWLPDEPVHGARQICSTEFLVITPREGWSREQLYCRFVEAGFRRMLEQRASGTSNSHQRIKPKDFEKTVVVFPPEEARETFLQIVEPLFATAANLHREAQTLAAIRDTLLPQLISGELRVQPSERASGEAVCR